MAQQMMNAMRPDQSGGPAPQRLHLPQLLLHRVLLQRAIGAGNSGRIPGGGDEILL